MFFLISTQLLNSITFPCYQASSGETLPPHAFITMKWVASSISHEPSIISSSCSPPYVMNFPSAFLLTLEIVPPLSLNAPHAA